MVNRYAAPCHYGRPEVPDSSESLLSRVLRNPTDSAVIAARCLDSCQRSELHALRDGRWIGELDSVAGLREIGLQDEALGVTDLGEEVATLLDLPWSLRDHLQLTRSRR